MAISRVRDRRRAIALARHYREAEGLSIAQIADHLGRSLATIKAYFYDPTGEKARAVKARYQGVCRGCGAYTQPRNGKRDAYAYCKACHPGAIARRWTCDRVNEAMLDWRRRYGGLPSSYIGGFVTACVRKQQRDGGVPASASSLLRLISDGPSVAVVAGLGGPRPARTVLAGPGA